MGGGGGHLGTECVPTAEQLEGVTVEVLPQFIDDDPNFRRAPSKVGNQVADPIVWSGRDST